MLKVLDIYIYIYEYLREGVGSVGSRRGEGGEESRTAGGFDSVDHAAARLSQV